MSPSQCKMQKLMGCSCDWTCLCINQVIIENLIRIWIINSKSLSLTCLVEKRREVYSTKLGNADHERKKERKRAVNSY